MVRKTGLFMTPTAKLQHPTASPWQPDAAPTPHVEKSLEIVKAL
jgi:hypothetical protein